MSLLTSTTFEKYMFKRLATRFDQITESINVTPWKRRTAIGAFFLLYTATGLAGYQYLQDTRFRATGEPNPYKPMKSLSSKPEIKSNEDTDGDSGIVPAHDTTPVYNQLASEYDSKINLEEIASYIWWMRRRVGKLIKGDALEIACGTGRNLRWLFPSNISSLTLVDPSLPMLEVAQKKFEKLGSKMAHKPYQFVKGRVEDLEKLCVKSGQRFDTVYETFGLCSHEDPVLALKQMANVLKPDGYIVLLEHGRGKYESMNQRMDKRAAQRAKEWGCRWNLDIAGIVKDSGLKIVDQDNYHFGTVYFYVLKHK